MLEQTSEGTRLPCSRHAILKLKYIHYCLIRSVRIPSAFCGLYALRPSSHRLPYRGLANSSEGQEAVHSVIGPMTPTVSGLKVFTQAILASEPWLRDPLVLRKAWNEDEYRLKEHGGGVGMCFAIMEGTGIVEPTPPMLRALKELKSALEAAGHTGNQHLVLSLRLLTIWNSDRLGKPQARRDSLQRRASTPFSHDPNETQQCVL